MQALIAYYSRTGHTLESANDIGRGLEDAGVEVTVKQADQVEISDISAADIFIAGSPTYGSTRYKAPAKAVARLLDSLGPAALEGKRAGAFSVMAGYGAEKIVAALEARLAELGATVVSGGPAVKAGAPLSLWTGPIASREDVEKCEAFGRRVAEAAG